MLIVMQGSRSPQEPTTTESMDRQTRLCDLSDLVEVHAKRQTKRPTQLGPAGLVTSHVNKLTCRLHGNERLYGLIVA